MFVLRPIEQGDLDSLMALMQNATFGLTSLPLDKKLLKQRIDDSIQAMQQIQGPPRGEAYLFVLEDVDQHQVIGTSGIVSKVGGYEPFYAYRIEASVHQCHQLNVSKQVPTLHLVEEHDGPSEIGSLFLLPNARKCGVGRLLSLSRFLFIANHPQQFDDQIIAEMRGVIDGQGHSPLWEAIGRHFFDIEFPHADYLSIINKRFIADLMPKHPIYIPLLPKTAQDVIGQVHDNTLPAFKLLQREGFEFNDLVDIFEGGPVLTCARDQIRAVRESKVAIVKIIDVPAAQQDGKQAMYLVSNVSKNFRACKTALKIDADMPDAVTISCDVAEALHVQSGQTMRYVPERPS